MRKVAKNPDVRIRDLRSAFAVQGVACGASLEMLDRLVGHTRIVACQCFADQIDARLKAGE